MPYAKMFLTLQGLIEASQDFRAGKDEALKSAFQRMEATCKQFGKAPMYHWMTSQLQRVSGNIDKALEEMQAVREGIQDIANKKPVYRIQKEIAWCYFVKGGEFNKVVEFIGTLIYRVEKGLDKFKVYLMKKNPLNSFGFVLR